MEYPGEEHRPDSDSYQEEEGGPVKSFLDHLEDLRWVLIKCVVAVGILMIICLIAANYVLAVVKWPLIRADKYRKPPGAEIHLLSGTNIVSTLHPGTNITSFAGVSLSNETRVAFEMVPKQLGPDFVLTLQPLTNVGALAYAPRGTILRNLSPVGGFWVAFQVALYGGIVLAAPILIYVIGSFIIPALRLNEKKYLLRGFGIGTALFLAGVSFCYFFLMPMALRASFQYSEWLGFSADEWRAEDYISFVCKFMLGMGLGFELPVVVLTLVKIGVLNYERLKALRRYMIVVNLILGAVLTTPEVVTQVLMFIPLQALYELSVWIAGYWEMDASARRRARIKLALVLLALLAAIVGVCWRFNVTAGMILKYLID